VYPVFALPTDEVKMGKYTDFLRDTDLFYNLTPTQLELIENICEERIYQAGETIFEENAHENELYIIYRGQVEISVSPSLVAPHMSTEVHSESVAKLLRGQSFGEVALVDEGIRTGTAKAREKNTILLRIPRQKLIMLCNTYPELGYRVMYNLAADLAGKIRNADLKIREVLLYQKNQSKT